MTIAKSHEWKFVEAETFELLNKELSKIEKEYVITDFSFTRERFCYTVMLRVEKRS